MTSDADLAKLAARLTLNAAINLRNFVIHPNASYPDCPWGAGRIHTGLGKYTTLAAIGVLNCLHAVSASEEVHHGYGRGSTERITPLGRELAAFIAKHWDDLEFRMPIRK